jgi:hypothetical protein
MVGRSRIYPFPGLVRLPYYLRLLRLLGLFLIGMIAFLLSRVIWA